MDDPINSDSVCCVGARDRFEAGIETSQQDHRDLNAPRVTPP